MIVDDHELVRLGFASLLAKTSVYELHADCASAHEAYALLLNMDGQNKLPDVLVSDLSLEGPSGFELIARVRERFAGMRILALSMHEQAAVVLRAMKAGANGFFCKSSRPSQLKDAIETIASGRPYIDPSVADALADYEQTQNLLESLSRREFEVLQLVGKGQSYLQIGQQLNLSSKTVANHLSAVRQKLQVESDFQLLRVLDEHAYLGSLPSK